MLLCCVIMTYVTVSMKHTMMRLTPLWHEDLCYCVTLTMKHIMVITLLWQPNLSWCFSTVSWWLVLLCQWNIPWCYSIVTWWLMLLFYFVNETYHGNNSTVSINHISYSTVIMNQIMRMTIVTPLWKSNRSWWWWSFDFFWGGSEITLNQNNPKLIWPCQADSRVNAKRCGVLIEMGV